MEMSALTLLSWEVMSVLWCGFLVVGGDALEVGSTGLGAGGWLDAGGAAGWLTSRGAAGWLAGGGAAGAGRLGLTTDAVGWYTLPDRVTSTHVSMA